MANKKDESPGNQFILSNEEPKNSETIEKTQESFSDILYREITSVIGPDNSDQFFCMSLPGTIIEPNQYKYDVENNEVKPSFVEANESKLVNKLFDACKMSSGDNGRNLASQYMSSIDILTPKLNSELFNAKNKLREVLQTKVPKYDENGNTINITLQELFYQYYDEYIEAKQAWAMKKLSVKKQIARDFPSNSEEDNKKRKNEYLEWYETNAETELLNIEEKLGKVLSVFSPSDMNIILGILESGGGRELYEARNLIDSVSKPSPDGAKIYPVTLYPENWFDLLDSSFQEIDLLESPKAISQKIYTLQKEKYNLSIKKQQIMSAIPGFDEINELNKKKEASENALNKTFTSVQNANIKTSLDSLKILINALNETKKENEGELANEKIKETAPKDYSDHIDSLNGLFNESINAQNDFVNAIDNSTSTALELANKNNLLQLKETLEVIQQQITSIENEIEELEAERRLSKAMIPSNIDVEASVCPNNQNNSNSPDDNFTDIMISSNFSTVTRKTESKSSQSETTHGLSFLFGGYKHKDTINESSFSEKGFSKQTSIDIGMSVAKVTIEREWFNPGIFTLTEDMFSTSSLKISPEERYSDFNDKRFEEMNKCIFPCFPVAFLIAKNVTIQFSTNKTIDETLVNSVEEHSSTGGGFFIFSGGGSKSSSSTTKETAVSSSNNAIRIRFKNPQIIGYYLEATPADKSHKVSAGDSNGDFTSIFQFVNDFKKMINESTTSNEDVLI